VDYLEFGLTLHLMEKTQLEQVIVVEAWAVAVAALLYMIT
jgi:hypothetical protein